MFTIPEPVIWVTSVRLPFILEVPSKDCPHKVLAVNSLVADKTFFKESEVLSTFDKPTSDLERIIAPILPATEVTASVLSTLVQPETPFDITQSPVNTSMDTTVVVAWDIK